MGGHGIKKVLQIRRRGQPATADAEGLRRFLEGEVLPWFEARKKELANRPLIREQAFGESLDPSGAPRGERNGNYRHGLFTGEAVAERRVLGSP